MRKEGTRVSRRKSTVKKTSFHLSVPIDDKDVIKWLESQDNMSVSIRMLIGAFVSAYGFCDATSYVSRMFANHSDSAFCAADVESQESNVVVTEDTQEQTKPTQLDDVLSNLTL